MSKLYEKIISIVRSIQRSTHTPFQAVKNIKFKKERLEMDYDNGQCKLYSI